MVGGLAARALMAELMLTPKPGLVDQRNAGAHADMDLAMFQRSAAAISPWMPRFVLLGLTLARSMPDSAILREVRAAGIECEAAMYSATRGVNTHKGAIFSLGLLCSGAGLLAAEGVALTRAALCGRVATLIEGIVERELGRASDTAGQRAFRRYGFSGARGEAAGGFRTVREVALPVHDTLAGSGVAEDTVLMQVLLHLMAVNRDTNLVSRGGLAGLAYVRRRAAALLREGGALAPGGVRSLEQFDDALIARNLSPSGSADLLAVAWFLARVGVGHATYA